MSEQYAVSVAADLTAAAAEFRARQAAGTHTVEVVRFDENGMQMLADAIESLRARVAVLENDNSQQVAASQQVTVPEVVTNRLEALEQHAEASGGLVEALRLVMELARERDERIARLEDEATETHSIVASVMPSLLAISTRRVA